MFNSTFNFTSANATLISNATSHATFNATTVPGQPFYHKEPEALETFRKFVFGVVIFAALLGNTIVIQAIRTGPSRKPFTYYLVTSLSVAELISSFCLIFLFDYEERLTWVFGEFMCLTTLPIITITFTVVTHNLAAIALYRYRVVVTPHKRPPSRKVAFGCILATWVFPIIISIPNNIQHIHEEKDGDEVWCYEQDPLINYSLARFFLCFAIPMMIMVVAYGLSALQIRQHMNILQTKHRQRLNSNIGSMNGENNRLSITATTTQGSINNLHRQIPQNQTKGSYNNLQLGAGQAHEIGEPVQYIAGDKPQIVIHSPQGISRVESSMMESERDVIRMFYAIVLIFLLCYIPYQIFYLISYFEVISNNSPYYYLVRKYLVLLTCFPSALHPLCYGTMSRFYAKAFSAFILCKCKNREL
ncbi:neuropeptide Y receptor type 1 isoform X2 [Nematostella vectensis]|nr:neuropeptide Y receptor type 1 isoform X2 [Nematostella vectensis]XP_048582119.1 neuropeptide Y receptor type 1 isoform X2 [Nematostella vectensis]XP_048582120.1 neuropeptide Y receptor type 1 isoform X2 [Nematostella vectensis]XP_048582121.1 neuropeptide Y receptor type 1 isoform X2 [Nematostella vectensis]XP_048582122.1 neuropeptide Y receptor type 1 isoform X2 [Nematostella vectensis]